MPSPRRAYAVLAGGALALAPLVEAAMPAAAVTTSVALAGSLQSELGCPDDWQPACSATELTRVGDTTAYAKTFTLPAGSYEFKVAINDSWDVNYGAGGVFDGPNIPLVLEGSATLKFTYDDVSHLVTFTPQGLAGGTTSADAALAANSLRSPLTKERFYFLMADRFANGTAANDKGGLTGGPLTTGFDPTHKGFYHGGDLKGVLNKLDYIKGMGTTAIWLTPSFKNSPCRANRGRRARVITATGSPTSPRSTPTSAPMRR
ncbi:alpha-amylase family glycosyl hydrolase [Knoellia sp. CPCC 206453]|uniref:pullulanase X25 domain-containing protein n=1 Tax=Knoellia pratensis TaxID=3404796 RepID=UPI00361C7FFD